MTFLTQNFEFFLYFFFLLVLPFGLAHLICSSLRVREFTFRLGWVLFFIAAAILPFLARMIQRDRYGYQSVADLKWISIDQVDETTDPATGAVSAVEKGTGTPVKRVDLTLDDMESKGGKWLFVDPASAAKTNQTKGDEKSAASPVEVVNRVSFDPSRWRQALSFGIDLAGGTNLIYEVADRDGGGDEVTVDNGLMDRMVGAVMKRVNPNGTKEIVIRRVGEKRIEIILPGADQAVVEQIKQEITELGSLEFAILANQRDHGELIRQALGNPAKKVPFGQLEAQWVPIAPATDARGRQIPNTEFDGDPEIAVRQIVGLPRGFNEILVVYEPEERRVTGHFLQRAEVTTANSGGGPAVGFRFNLDGGYRFYALTSRNAPRQDGSRRRLAVLLNGEVQTAPSINSPIDRQGVIESDRFTLDEVQKYVNVLNAGALPVPLKSEPISEFTISPTLGADVQSKGRLALIVSSLVVLVFMAVYYRTAGMIANIALLMNLLFIVSAMVYLKAAFTLPGLAGLVLSAGMAVDANVLIYERMREELERGASLRMAIHNGFDKAFVAIFDSNITTLLTALILYVIGTEQVKGFAISLFIGLVVNLYTAVYCSRLLFNILERSRVLTKVNFMNAIGKTNIDFVGKQNIAILASLTLILVGLGCFFARGTRNYDIDFMGGTSVTMQFEKPQQTDTVRERLEGAFGTKNITVEELSPSADIPAGTFFRFRLASETDVMLPVPEIEKKVSEAFRGELVRRTMKLGELTEIAGAPKTDGETEAAAADEFAGGQRVTLSFADPSGKATRASEIAPATLANLLERKLASIPGEDGATGSKYGRSDSLLALEGKSGSGLQTTGNRSKTYSDIELKVSKVVSPEDLRGALSAIATEMDNEPVFDEVTSFESSVADEAKWSALMAILASLLAIVAYVWFRFDNIIFGLAAVVALAHDVLVTLAMVAICSYLSRTPIAGLFQLTDFKINMPMIAAFLTIVGYSINDTIVIFDRLREVRGKNPEITKEMINETVNQTLSRTILTALTVLLTVIILYALGGEGIHGFAFCMVIGAIAGTYSTVYIASPLVLWFMNRFGENPAPAKRKVEARPEAA
jgi:SecD/SecF fusion protein